MDKQYLSDMCPSVNAEFWNRCSVNNCFLCDQVSHLLDGLCWDCRQQIGGAILSQYLEV
jgi:hypothetical protein